MRYELINNGTNNYNSPTLKEDILKCRGILNPQQYLNLNKDVEIHYSKLNNIDKAVTCLLKHVDNNDLIYIQIDNDCDGYCSASILYMYLKEVFANLKIKCNVQEGKKHGVDIQQVPQNAKLVIIPDAGSNQFDEHKILKEKGIDVIVLDHHEAEKESEYAIVVNNQLSPNYSNKQLSGVGIVYKFLQALDDELWLNSADDYLDLVALGNIADVMNLQSMETRYYINNGLKNIRNKFFRALINKQQYNINNKINPINIGFYISPLINSMVRFGSLNDKKLMFEAFIGSNKIFKYQPRKKNGDETKPEIVEENIYEHVVRLCVNTRTKQNKSKNIDTELFIQKIIDEGLDKNKIIVVDATNELKNTMTGLMATQIVNYFHKPCLVLRENDKDTNTYNGSGRGINNSELKDLKAFLTNLNIFDSVEGHANAHGIQIKKDNVDKFIELSNKALKDINFDNIYTVDYIIPFEELTDDFIEIVCEMNDIWGQGVPECLIAIKNVEINTKNILLKGKKQDTISFEIEDITFIKFKCKEDDFEKLTGDWENIKSKVKLNIIGRCNINEYNHERKLQITISDWEILE